MRRLLCLLALLPGLVHHASAQQAPPQGDDKKLPTYLTQKFGLAKEKAAQISEAVTTAAAKYSLPPAVLLAIISVESRFHEKARGGNNATGLMQVVPSAHRNLLRNVKDLTDPDVNIDVGSSILYGYKRAAGGDLDAAMKNYGGSKAYAEKIRTRAAEFSRVLDSASATSAAGAAGAADNDDAATNFSGAFSATIPASEVAATVAQGASAPASSGPAQATSTTSAASGADPLAGRHNSRSRER
ncbi:transglycosylase SLT domain-containing protein [Paraburkholderia bannensis]|uniref:transglycosylase SLT domain-containing protein n=1 Tax=Paraburkholderia bannensis TaxID=765414 RepID=UPI002ABDD4A8|nr:transglycosylase SLT domain-containing protein [Paraburkholderia bannensis]